MLEQLISQLPRPGGRSAAARRRRADAGRPRPASQAMASGAAVIIGGLLPVDGPGHRVGRPDLLVRGADTHRRHARLPPGRGQVAQDPANPAGRTAEPADRGRRRAAGHPLLDARPSRPRSRGPLPARAVACGSAAAAADLLQLAHYHRMLRGLRARRRTRAGRGDRHRRPVRRRPCWSGRISTSRWCAPSPAASPRAGGCAACWSATTSSTASGSRSPRSPGSRPAIPSVDPAPLVRPIVNREVRPLSLVGALPAPAGSGRRQPAASTREPWTRGRSSRCAAAGSTTVTDLARVDLDELLAWYLPEVTHRSGAEARLRTAARRARMLVDGDWFARETDRPDRGARGRHRDRLRHRDAPPTGGSTCGASWSGSVTGSERLHEFSRFADLDDDGGDRARRGGVRLAAQRRSTAATGSWSTTTAGTRWP